MENLFIWRNSFELAWRNNYIYWKREFTNKIFGPVTDHDASDDCGVKILGQEENKFWHDNKGAKINAIRTRKGIEQSDIVVVKFGEKYRQWNAAFDAGYASALGKSLIIMHQDDFQHALKEVDASALAIVKNNQELLNIFKYVITGKLWN